MLIMCIFKDAANCYVILESMTYERKYGIILIKWTEWFGEKPVTFPLCPPQIPYGLLWEWTRASPVTGRWPTAEQRHGRDNGDYGHNNYYDYLPSLQGCTLITNNNTLMTFILHCDRYFHWKDVYLCHIVFSCVCKQSVDVAIRTPFTCSM